MSSSLPVLALVSLSLLPQDEPSTPEPGGALIVHARELGGPFCLWRLELAADGLAAEPERLTEGPGWSYAPTWQHHGKRVVYLARADGQTERREMGVDGSDDRPHVPDADAERDLAVSPDGQWLAYAEKRNGVENVYLRPTSGEGEERAITSGPGNDLSPRWSPDGRHLLLRSDRDGKGMELYVLEIASGEVDRITNDEAFVNDASFSPDGEHVLYRSNRTGSHDLYVVPASGGRAVPITSSPAFDGEGCWSPDGAWIAFASDRDGNQEIYLVRPDGTGLLRVTWSDERDESWPAWVDV